MMIRRRGYIALVGGAVAWPLLARAQQPAMPVIGLLNTASPNGFTERLRGFRQGLKEAGYVVAFEYRWAEGQHDQLLGMAADLVRRDVTVIAAISIPTALAAKAQTTTI